MIRFTQLKLISPSKGGKKYIRRDGKLHATLNVSFPMWQDSPFPRAAAFRDRQARPPARTIKSNRA